MLNKLIAASLVLFAVLLSLTAGFSLLMIAAFIRIVLGG